MMMKKTYCPGRAWSVYHNAIVLLAAFVVMAMPWDSAMAEQSSDTSIVLAVEFNAHAACAHVAKEKGWYEAEGIHLKSYDSYVTGMALAAALMRGDVDAAYICMIPAINVYANGKVPLKILAGTHKYGYAMVVDPRVITGVHDLEKPGIRIGCSREGSPVDVVLHRIIETRGLDGCIVADNVRRMSPPQQLMALKAGQLDAAVVPEQYPRMAEQQGFKVLVQARDLWPDMQGSVLVVTDKLIRKHPDVVEKLVAVTKKATRWVNQNQAGACRIIASRLNGTGECIFPAKAARLNSAFVVTPEVVKASLEKGLQYSTDIDEAQIKETISYLVKLGYIRKPFAPGKILDLRWLSQ